MKNAFCTKEQETTQHKVSLDTNGDFVFTCQTKDCERFFKLAGSTETKDIDGLLKKEEEANKGQISVEEQEKKLAQITGEAEDPEK